MIHTGDAVKVMRTMPSESVDAIVTDPPAGISFMSKNWDHDKGGRTQWVAWMTEVMRECYRVLKPGGYAVVWSLPRTCHWTAWAMEDAGFIIRDQLAHIFASGFPKGRAQLKPAREDWWLARKPGPLRPLNIEETRIGTTDEERAIIDNRSGGQSTETEWQGPPVARSVGEKFTSSPAGRWPSNLLLSDPELFDEPNPWVVGSGATARTFRQQNDLVETQLGQHTYNKGWSIKPGVREGFEDSGGYSRFFTIPRRGDERDDGVEGGVRGEDVRDDGPEVAGHHRGDVGGESDRGEEVRGVSDVPTSREYPTAFLIPKADRRDREPIITPDGHDRSKRFSTHPTQKPTDLMRHLIRLVTPPGGTVLDPFLGSGSTAIAAELEGFPWVGIEKEPEYVAIAEARLNGTQRGLGLDVGAPTRRTLTPPRKNPAVMRSDGKRSMYGPARKAGTNLSKPDSLRPDEEPAA